MGATPIPSDEHHRLAILEDYAILDTGPEPAYDDLTSLASTICATPIAILSFVDSHRQWFKSRIGLGVPETHRDWSFCAYAITEPDRVMVVADARRDDRFSQNPFVTGDQAIIFYAGAPVVAPGGEALGTVCVIDHEPRTLTPDHEKALRALANQAMALLELRRHMAMVERRSAARQRYQSALERRRRDLHASMRLATERSLTDELTGVANGDCLDARLGEQCATMAERGDVISVAMVDVDRIKDVNDVAGRQYGDEVLAGIAAVIEAEIRGCDTVGRAGGDEFLVLLPSVDAPQAAVVAERIRCAVRSAEGPAGRVTVSVGVATAQAPIDPDSLVALADRALYQAKSAGRDTVMTAIDIADSVDTDELV